jgi:large subunit ribosomal protein L4
MSKLSVHDMRGGALGEMDFPDALLTKRGQQAVHDVVVAYQAGLREGSASTLGKGAVAGSGKKPWRQKGTGRARAGYRQSPVWRGGGVAFGPHPREYGGKVNKKVARLAFRRALSEKIRDGELKVVESLDMEEPKTRRFVQMLKSLGIRGPALFLPEKVSRNVGLAARNVGDVEVVPASAANVYQILRYPVVVADRAGVGVLARRLDPGREGGK